MPRNSASLRVSLTGSAEIQRLLRELALETRGPILRLAVARAGRPIVKLARRLAPRDTGALARSIEADVRKPRKSAEVYAVIGPARGYYKSGKRIKSGSYQGAAAPANYAHLVEFGHIKATGGRLTPTYNLALQGTGKFRKDGSEKMRYKRSTIKEHAKGKIAGLVAAKPFLRPAFSGGAAMAAQEFATGIEQGLARAVDRLRRRPAA